jgi:hypothetical protein
MPWVMSADLSACTRCDDGSHLVHCLGDDDCTLFNDGYGYRCATDNWNGRRYSPGTSVCVPRCASDGDCALGGHCDLSDGNHDGTPDGVCRDASGNERPAGTTLACRPIGCDICWQNDYCDSDSDCPAKHHCSGATKANAPLCVLRPLLSKKAVKLVTQLDPDAGPLLDGVRDRLTGIVSSVSMPAIINSGGHKLTQFATHITDARVYVGSNRTNTQLQGTVVLHLDFGQTRIEVEGLPIDDQVDSWSAEVIFEPHVQEGSGGDYSIVGLDLVDVTSELSVKLLGFIPIEVGDQIAGTLRQRLAPFAGPLVSAVLTTLGSRGLARCMFVSDKPDDNADLPAFCPLDNAWEPAQMSWAENTVLRVTLRACTQPPPVDGGADQ